MSDLKILKDLEIDYVESYKLKEKPVEAHIVHMFANYQRGEIIKIINLLNSEEISMDTLESLEDTPLMDLIEGNNDFQEKENLIKFMMWYYNLSEEDLQ